MVHQEIGFADVKLEIQNVEKLALDTSNVALSEHTGACGPMDVLQGGVVEVLKGGVIRNVKMM